MLQEQFQIQEFARLAGVTVRALRHYDRLGLLSPASRSEAGHRLYTRDDLGRLERLLVLRYLGLPLREIGELLAAGGPEGHASLPETLARQAAVLRERRAELSRVLRAIEHAQTQAARASEPDWILYQSILKELHMHETQHHWTDKYYSPAGLQLLRERWKDWTPELQAEISAKWQALFAEVQNAIDTNLPLESPEARDIARRWFQLAEAFTQGNPELREGVRRWLADRENWPQDAVAEQMKRNLPSAEHTQWLGEVMRAQLMAS